MSSVYPSFRFAIFGGQRFSFTAVSSREELLKSATTTCTSPSACQGFAAKREAGRSLEWSRTDQTLGGLAQGMMQSDRGDTCIERYDPIIRLKGGAKAKPRRRLDPATKQTTVPCSPNSSNLCGRLSSNLCALCTHADRRIQNAREPGEAPIMSGLGGMGGMGGMGGLGSSGMQNQEQMRMMQIMQEMQMVDSLRMYNELVERCFGHCVSKFRTRKLDGPEVREHAPTRKPRSFQTHGDFRFYSHQQLDCGDLTPSRSRFNNWHLWETGRVYSQVQ